MRKLLFFLLIPFCWGVWAQDFGFGFSEDSDEETPSAPPLAFKLNGEAVIEAAPYVFDFLETVNIKEISYWNVKVNFAVSSLYLDLFTNLNFNADAIGELWSGSSDLKHSNYTPRFIDEVFFRAYVGQFNIEAGYRKLSWGRADSPGPLDVTNPIDYTDLRNITDIRARKIARPMLHVTWNTGDFSRLESVFIPNFYGHRFASAGRWAPSRLSGYADMIKSELTSQLTGKWKGNPLILLGMIPQIEANLLNSFTADSILSGVNTSGLKYFQTGIRYTTTIGSSDVGGQYYYGSLFRPDFSVKGIDTFVDTIISTGGLVVNPSLISPEIKYTRYHQIGVDYARVVYGFNIRAEAAFHLTKDTKGDDGSSQNPFIGWSLGFDRELIQGINLNLQCDETIRLFNSKVGENPILDTEAGSKITSTRLSARLSKNFLKDKLESKATVIWDIENSDCYIIPSVAYNIGNLKTELSAGIFAGNESGEFGQYWENCFIKAGLKYSF